MLAVLYSMEEGLQKTKKKRTRIGALIKKIFFIKISLYLQQNPGQEHNRY